MNPDITQWGGGPLTEAEEVELAELQTESQPEECLEGLWRM